MEEERGMKKRDTSKTTRWKGSTEEEPRDRKRRKMMLDDDDDNDITCRVRMTVDRIRDGERRTRRPGHRQDTMARPLRRH